MSSKEDISLKQVIAAWTLTIGIILMTVFNINTLVASRVLDITFMLTVDFIYILTFLIASISSLKLSLLLTITHRRQSTGHYE